MLPFCIFQLHVYPVLTVHQDKPLDIFTTIDQSTTSPTTSILEMFVLPNRALAPNITSSVLAVFIASLQESIHLLIFR